MTSEEFRISLQHGRGRAFKHVLEHGIATVSGLVAAACLKNQAYDRQCESGRSEWLFRMFVDTSELAHFEQLILSALSTTTDRPDLIQLCELTALLAKHGSKEASTLLLEIVLKQEDDWPVGYGELKELIGSEACVYLAKQMGQRLLSDPTARVATLEGVFEETAFIEQANGLLTQLAKDDKSIEAFLRYQVEAAESSAAYARMSVEEHRHEGRSRLSAELTVEGCIEMAYAKLDRFPTRFASFGRIATKAELHNVFSLALSEPDEDVVTRLLWVFRGVELPSLDARIFEFTSSQHLGLRKAAIAALTQTQSAEVGDFARSRLLREGELGRNPELVRLLERNFHSGDGALLIRALHALDLQPGAIHQISLSFLSLCRNSIDSANDLLNWIYEYTPCTSCRRDSVEGMIDIGYVLPEILVEAAFDASGETRALARGRVGDLWDER